MVSTLGVGFAVTGPASASPARAGYWLESGDGGVFSFGAPFEGSAASDATRCPANPPGRSLPDGSCWSMTPTADGAGYWILNAVTGVIYPYGDAVTYGQPADTPAYSAGADLRPDAIAMVATTDGKGYWVLEKGLSGLGSIQAFGDAVNFGDEATIAHATGHVGTPVAMAATSDDGGYWIVDSDGGVFSFGDATFEGSMGGRTLAAPVVGIAAVPGGTGYWLAGADGGVFSFGDATFGGSVAGTVLAGPVVGITAAPGGKGYWLAGSDGGVFALGGAPFLGSMGGHHLDRPVFAISAAPAPVT